MLYHLSNPFICYLLSGPYSRAAMLPAVFQLNERFERVQDAIE